MDKILLFIPAYNCEKQIIRVLKQIDEGAKKHITEVIVVNNRSTDETEQAVLTFNSEYADLNIRLLRNCQNYNLGGSHKVAFDYAIKNEFDYVIVLHGDDQGDIHDLLPFLENGEYKNHDCCLGARFKAGSRLVGYSKFRTFGNIVFNKIFSVLLFKKIYDLGSGLNIYRVSMLNDRFYARFPNKLTFNYCMIMAADYYNHDMFFFPISWREDDQFSNVKLTSQAFNVLGMLIKYFFLRGKFIKSDLCAGAIDYAAEEVL